MTSFFSTLVDFVHAHSQYTHIAIFLLALSEAIPVVGTVVPGSTLIIGISALATSANANPWLLLIAAIAGAIIGRIIVLVRPALSSGNSEGLAAEQVSAPRCPE
jgi:membrane protein DedA with SNARE-associated domain